MITENELLQAEKAIEELADSLKISEKELVSIIKLGMEAKAPISNQLSKTNKYFIDEMENTFGY